MIGLRPIRAGLRPAAPGSAPPLRVVGARRGSVFPTAENDADAKVLHFLERASIGGLVSGQSYIVLNSSGSTFSLADPSTPGTVITLDALGRSGTHSFQLAGIDLAGTAGTHEMRIDVTSKPAGNHRLLGPGGTSLRLSNPPQGDGLSTARTEGGTGGVLFTISVPTAKLRITNDAQAWIAGTPVDAGGDIKVATQSVSRGDSYISNGSPALTLKQ